MYKIWVATDAYVPVDVIEFKFKVILDVNSNMHVFEFKYKFHLKEVICGLTFSSTTGHRLPGKTSFHVWYASTMSQSCPRNSNPREIMFPYGLSWKL